MEKILEFLGSNKFPLITKLTESNTVWVYSSPVKLQVREVFVISVCIDSIVCLGLCFNCDFVFVFLPWLGYDLRQS